MFSCWDEACVGLTGDEKSSTLQGRGQVAGPEGRPPHSVGGAGSSCRLLHLVAAAAAAVVVAVAFPPTKTFRGLARSRVRFGVCSCFLLTQEYCTCIF